MAKRTQGGVPAEFFAGLNLEGVRFVEGFGGGWLVMW